MMEDKKQLIIDAVNYVNDIPARVEEFLFKEKFKEDYNLNARYYIGCDPTEERLKPNFKIGDWVIRTVGKDSMNHELGRVFKIASLNQIEDGDGITHFSSSLRHATHKEIETHLIEEAIKKGFVMYRKFMWHGEKDVSTIKLPFSYRADIDSLITHVFERDSNPRAIYWEGKWAEPIFDLPKKKLPRTKQDLAVIIKTLRLKKNLTLYNEDIEIFLNDYED